MAKYHVTLSPEERDGLQQMVSKGKAAARKLAHARILLLADEGENRQGSTDEKIIEALGVGARTVSRVRKKFVTEGVEAAINPRPQPQRPAQVKIDDSVEQELMALVQGEPPAGRCQWTLELLAERLVVLKLVESVSKETVRKTLKKMTSCWEP
jgi:transposase